MTQLRRICWCALLAASMFLLPLRVAAQSATVTDDAFLSSNSTTQQFNLNGQGIVLVVAGSSAMVNNSNVGATKAYIKFQLNSSLPPGTAAANVIKATLKLYLSPLTKPSGTIDIYPLTSAWTESTLNPSSPPALFATAFATQIPVGQANSFLVVDVTKLVQEWLMGSANGGLDNDGIALVADTSTTYVVFDSKESIVTSHEPRLEIVLANSGPQGSAGAAATIQVGTTSTLGPNERASVTNGGTTSAAILNFAIPQGQPGAPGTQGPPGQAATIKVEPTMTVPYPTPASVMNSGTPNAADLTFLIPQGPPGAAGAQGPQGLVGINNSGPWNKATAYNKNDAVFDSGSYWQATTANAGSEPSPTNTNWQLLAGGIVNRGVWNSSNSYNVNDAVSDGGSYWLALVPTSASNATPNTSCEPAYPPSPCAADWQLLAAQGAQGPQGQTGAQGPQGIQGPIGLSPTNAAITTLANTFTMDQTITGNLIIGGTGNGVKFPDGTSLTTGSSNSATGANPRMIASAFLPGALNTPYTAATFTPDLAITVTHVTAQIKTAADPSCTQAVLRVGNSTAAQDLVLASSQNTIDSGAMALPLPANGAVSVKLQTAASCSAGSTPSDANVLLQYRMQNSGDTTSCASSGQVCTTGGVGVCKLTQSDVNNCGSCGNVCPSGAACTNGTCSIARSQVTATYFVQPTPYALAGQSVTLIAALGFTASNGVPIPTGSVTFSDTFQGVTTQLGTVSLSPTASGQPPSASYLYAQFSTTTLAAGTHTITAQYAGDINYLGASWAPPALSILKSQSTASYFVIPNSFTTTTLAGQSVTLIAALGFTASNGVPIPTGSVTFSDTFQGVTTQLGTVSLSPTASGQPPSASYLYAQFSTTTLAAGTHTITAQYGGDTNYLSASWAPPALTILKALSVADYFVISPTSPNVGQSVTLTAALRFTASNGVPIPTGSVTFSDTFGGVTTVLGTVQLAATASGQPTVAGELYAQFSTTTLAAGSHTITAQYGGDNNYLGASWAPPSLAVNP